jgi:RHS repeat-associated protein
VAVSVTSAGGDAGLLQQVTDPRGLVSKLDRDALGRVVRTVDAFSAFAPSASSDKTTEFSYDGSDHVLTVQADEPNGAHETTGYLYGVSPATGSTLTSNDVLGAVQYPDASTGNPSAGQQVLYSVNTLGQVLSETDRNGNVHQYGYDVLGRLTSDAVTTLGAGVDGAVRRIEVAYDTQGNPYLVTSFDSGTGGNIVNQVEQSYNGLGQLTAEYQSHSGAVNTSTTPYVGYGYNEMAGGANNSRPTSLTYPNGRVLSYNYAAGLDNSISRLTSITDGATTLESYKYLGLDTVVERDHPQSGVNLTYIQQPGDQSANTDGGDQYTGLDRFGRVIGQNWVNGAGTSVERLQYGYDRDGNLLWRNNLVNTAYGELYGYDNLNQLTSFQRGTLNATHTGLVGSASHSQSWGPDALGNFASVTTDGSTQTRTANQQNEITGISGAGAVTYDSNGNLTADGSGKSFVYDAWNRVVAVKQGASTLSAYAYDGLGRRVSVSSGGTTTDLYYSADWQVLEERVGGVVQAQNVWSPVYVDALVLRDQSSLHNGVLDQRLYAVQDANWNVTALLDTSGNVVERYVYDPYGAVSVLTPSWGARGSSAYGWLYPFQGGRYDGAAGLYNFGNRDYSPGLMRWLQNDQSFDRRFGHLRQYRGTIVISCLHPVGIAVCAP